MEEEERKIDEGGGMEGLSNSRQSSGVAHNHSVNQGVLIG